MTPSDLPLWAAWTIVAVTICGSLLALVGSAGLVVLKRFYERVHAPTLGATLGMALIVVASVVFWSMTEGRLALRDLLIGVTNFFRDPEAFQVLEERAIPQLFAGRPAGAVVREPGATACTSGTSSAMASASSSVKRERVCAP